MKTNKSEFRTGLKDGIPIALGYFAVSFSLGIVMVAANISAVDGAVMSLTNLTSAGEFAGVRIIAAGGTLIEMAFRSTTPRALVHAAEDWARYASWTFISWWPKSTFFY